MKTGVENRFIHWLSVVIGLFVASSLVAHSPIKESWNFKSERSHINEIDLSQFVNCPFHNYDSVYVIQKTKHKKISAIALAVTLGPFGVHRLYLGTEAKVPVIYTLTLGGGLGILPLIDIIAISAAKSSEEYAENAKVIMWAE